MPFQIGNDLGKNSRKVEAMIKSVLAQDDRGRLRQAIERTLDKAADGDLPCLDWLTNRIDGKIKGDDGEKGQLIQVVINGYADVQARIVDNSRVHDHEGVVAVTGGLESVGGVVSREPDDSLLTSEISNLLTSVISEAAPSESAPPGINSVQELEVVPSTSGG